MWYERTSQGFIKIYGDKQKPLGQKKKEVPRYVLSERVVDYHTELKKRREQIKVLGRNLANERSLTKQLRLENEKLKKELAAAQTGKKMDHIEDISLSSMVNEVRRRTDNSHKLAIFKKIIDDNVQLREELGTKKSKDK